jgi:hypothetical protein
MLFHTFRRVMLFLLPETETRDSDAGMRDVILKSFNLSTFPVLTSVAGPWANNDYNGQLGDDWSASPENHFPSAR